MTYKTEDGQTFRNKNDVVHFILATDADLAGWYKEQHGVDAAWAAKLTPSDCDTYGEGAAGDLCDMILKDAKVTDED